MKRILSVLLIAMSLYACKKGNTATPIIPTASFKVTNPEGDALIVKEGNILDFGNDSKDAASYKWDFGNGNISTEKNPTTFFFPSCGSEKKITLTVTSATGDTASFTQTYLVLCSGKMAPGTDGSHPPLPAAVSHDN